MRTRFNQNLESAANASAAAVALHVGERTQGHSSLGALPVVARLADGLG